MTSCHLSLQLVDFQILWNILSQKYIIEEIKKYIIEEIILKSPLEQIDEKT